MPLGMLIIGSLLLATLGACSQREVFVKESTESRLAAQYEFENRYTDVDDPD